MPKSVFGGAHRHLVQALVAARQRSGLTQRELAAKLGKDQSFVSIIEGGQRRVDVIEFFAIARALNANPVQLIREIEAALPHDIEI
jgi:transcriptional regulator with XRE-family HTH domain